MISRILFGLLWLGFGIYAFLLAPPDSPDTAVLIQNLSFGRWAGINPLIVALFNIMGILPGIYACLLFSDGRGQKFPAWVFSVLSIGIGAFGLLPYFALRSPNPTFVGEKTWLIKLFDSRWFGVLLTVGAGSLIFYGFQNGNWTDFIDQWQTNRFIHVMSLDFCLLCLLFPALLGDDMARRGMADNSKVFMAVAAIPLFGALAYLCLRSPLVIDANLPNPSMP